MKAFIIFIVVVVIVINGYTFLKYKKKKRKSFNTVDSFRNVYSKSRAVSPKSNHNTENYTRYITRYNSMVDYIEKDEFFKEAASHANPSTLRQGSKRTGQNKRRHASRIDL